MFKDYDEFIDEILDGLITDKDIPEMSSEVLKTYLKIKKIMEKKW